jgi:hypothetical protein
VLPLRLRLLLLSLAVLAGHLVLAGWLSAEMSRLGSGAGEALQRIDVAFVRELQASEPLVMSAPTPAARPAARTAAAMPAASAASAAAPASAASAADAAANPSGTPPTVVTEATPPDKAADDPTLALAPPSLADLPSSVAAPASGAETLAKTPPSSVSAAASAAANAPTAVAFEWPPSTRLSYSLVGDYRGPMEGSARVEWIRRGDLYQVHLDVNVGGVARRRMSSEGRLGEQGLQPRLYEEVTTALFRDTRRHVVRFEADRIILSNGQIQPMLPQVQDTASQFVQLTWLFSTQSHRLRPGETVEVPLALPRRVDRWLYDVQQEEEVQTPAGLIRAVHMKPRRLQSPKGELLVETWFAPSLQYLPVRIIIRHGDEAFADLTLSRLPQQAEAAPPAVPANTPR